MNAASTTILAIASLVMSGLSLLVSLSAVFPGMKGALLAVRDGVLWFAMFLMLGGGAFLAWQVVQQAKAGSPGAPRVEASRLPDIAGR